MKTTKCILALFTGLFVASTTLMADDGAVTVKVGSTKPLPNPVYLGSPVNVSYNGSTTDPSDKNCEITITNRIWNWTADDGHSQANGGSSWSFPWTPTSCGNPTVTATASVEFQGTNCHGVAYDNTFTSSGAGVTVTVLGLIYGAWQFSCPEVTTSPTVNPSSYSCIEISQVASAPVSKPTVTYPAYNSGQKHRSITYTCPDTTGPPTETASISYTVTPLPWEPPLPQQFDVAHLPQLDATHFSTVFQSKAYADVISSDSLCPSPGKVFAGTCNWTIIDIDPLLDVSSIAWTSSFSTMANNLVAGWFSLGTLSPINETDTMVDKYFCCNGAPSHSHYHEKAVNTGKQTLTPALTASASNNYGSLVSDILTAMGAADNAGAKTGITDYIANHFPSASIGINCSACDKSSTIDYGNDCYCPGSAFAGAWFGDQYFTIEFVPLTATIPIPADLLTPWGIHNGAISITLFAGKASYEKIGADSNPGSTSTVHTETTTASGNFYCQFTLGDITKTYSMFPDGNNVTNSVPSVLCEAGM
jgi:hypothetical protein